MLMLVRFDDVGLDARSQWVGKGKNSAFELIISTTKQALRMLGYTLFHVTLSLKKSMYIWLDQLVLFISHSFLADGEASRGVWLGTRIGWARVMYALAGRTVRRGRVGGGSQCLHAPPLCNNPPPPHPPRLSP